MERIISDSFYTEEDEKLLLINLNSEKECTKLLKLILNQDNKRNCYFKRDWKNMSIEEQNKCISILRDYLLYWSY